MAWVTSRSRTSRPLTKKYCMSACERENAGRAIQPCSLSPLCSVSIVSAESTKSPPQTRSTRASRAWSSAAPGRLRLALPLCLSSKATSIRASARRLTSSSMWLYSVRSVFRNLRRAGVLKNRSRTSMTVPGGVANGSMSPALPPSHSMRMPDSAPSGREPSDSRDTEAMLASASPRKPRLATASRSSSEAILLVACGCSASAISSPGMPPPSSVMRIRRSPPPSISIRIRRAPASRLFSASSLTTEAGRSMTSPAAIWLTRCAGRPRMGMRLADGFVGQHQALDRLAADDVALDDFLEVVFVDVGVPDSIRIDDQHRPQFATVQAAGGVGARAAGAGQPQFLEAFLGPVAQLGRAALGARRPVGALGALVGAEEQVPFVIHVIFAESLPGETVNQIDGGQVVGRLATRLHLGVVTHQETGLERQRVVDGDGQRGLVLQKGIGTAAFDQRTVGQLGGFRYLKPVVGAAAGNQVGLGLAGIADF